MEKQASRHLQISVRFSPAELARLEVAALTDGRYLADWIRRAALTVATLQGSKEIKR